ncbi:MAG: MFS transporter [Parcubacteria group bacterium]|nr:MFS transporter [Parcubacteria group bacterium]
MVRLKQNQKPFLPANVILLGVVSLLNDASSEMIYPLLPLFLTQELGASVFMVGLIEGVADATSAITRIGSGWFTDRIRVRKPLVVLGYTLAAIAKPLLAVATTPLSVLGLRFVDRLGKGTREAPRDVLIADAVSSARRGAAFGFHRAMDTLGATVGPLLALLLLPLIGGNVRILFLLSFFASILAVTVLVHWVREKPTRRKRSSSPLSLSGYPPAFAWFLVALFFLTLGSFSSALLILRAKELGIATLFIPFVYVLSNVVSSVFAYPAGLIGDHRGRRVTLLAGVVILIIVLAVFSLSLPPWMVALLFAGYGLFLAATEGTVKALAVDFSPRAKRGTTLGLTLAVSGVGAFFGTAGIGALWSLWGSSVAFLVAILMLVAAWIIFLIIPFPDGRKIARS